MGDCRFCGRSAGFLKNQHEDCKKQHEQGKAEIVSLVTDAASGRVDLARLMSFVRKTAKSSYIDQQTEAGLVVTGYERAVERVLDDHMLTEAEEAALVALQQTLPIAQQHLDRNGSLSKLTQAAVLRDISNGVIPERVEFSGPLPFNLQKSETLVWIIQDVKYYEEKTRTQFVGGSRGMSFRVAKGVYYRTGGFKGERVQTAETVHVDNGLLGVTTKHIYFSGSSKRFRINFNKIVAFEPFSDGIGVQRDAQTAKPQSFLTGDGWFTYNLVVNLAQM